MKHAEFDSPWQSKGRWYQFFVEVDNESYKLTTADLECCLIQDATATLWFPEGYHILNYIVDIHAIETDSLKYEIVFANNGLQGIRVPDTLDFDYATIYVFAYKEA